MSATLRAAMATTAVLVGATAMVGGAGTAWATGNHGGSNDHTVTLCHATASDSDPYDVETSDVSGVLNGHDGHSKKGRTDVIPPFTYVDKGKTKQYPGKGDQSILANGCQIPKPTTTTEAPEVEEPEVTVPTTEAPEVEEPEVTVPTTEAAEVEEPEVTVPTTEAPEVEEPEVTVPTTEAPEVEEPEVTVPTTEAPEVEEPEVTVPTTEAPEVEEPEVTVPTTEAPEMTVPTTAAPEVEEPEVTVPEVDPPSTVTPPTVAPAGPVVNAPETVATVPAGHLPDTGSATTGLLVAGIGALLAGVGLVQFAHPRRRAPQA